MISQIKNKCSKLFPNYIIVPLCLILTINCGVYFIIGQLVKYAYHYDFTTAFDNAVPLLPSWTSIYLVCYLFWAVGYIVILRQGKEICYRFTTAEIMAKLICGLFFLFLPTTNVRPELPSTGFWNQALQMVYQADDPVNLFPSIHCLVSWFCYIGVRKRNNIPIAYRIFSCVFALLVCISTQVTKQHYIVDFIGAIAFSELTWFLCNKYDFYRFTAKVCEAVTGFIFPQRKSRNWKKEAN